jgi:hypothetical protein
MDRLLEWVVKLMILLLLAPFVLCLIAQGTVALLAAVLPWLVLLGAVTGVTAGLAAAVMLRRRLPPRLPRSQFPSGFRGEPVRRPRGLRGRADE